MKYASEDLIHEHEGILFGLMILDQMTGRLSAGNEVSAKDLQEIIQFFKLFVDKCHHGKEEVLLFPSMEKAGIPKESGPIGQMLLEHEQGRQFVGAMDKAITGKGVSQEAFLKSANEYVRLLKNHIEKENTVLFPMGDKLIPQKRQAELLMEFEKFEEQVMGKGTHERLHGMLHVFEKKYLK